MAWNAKIISGLLWPAHYGNQPEAENVVKRGGEIWFLSHMVSCSVIKRLCRLIVTSGEMMALGFNLFPTTVEPSEGHGWTSYKLPIYLGSSVISKKRFPVQLSLWNKIDPFCSSPSAMATIRCILIDLSSSYLTFGIQKVTIKYTNSSQILCRLVPQKIIL